MIKPVASDSAILVVSDLPSLRDRLSEWLFNPRVRVLPAETADNVFRRAQELPFDLVVWDATPRTVGMSGVGVVVTDEFADTPAIILHPASATPAKGPGAGDRVQLLPLEPLTREMLLEAVRTATPKIGALYV